MPHLLAERYAMDKALRAHGRMIVCCSCLQHLSRLNATGGEKKMAMIYTFYCDYLIGVHYCKLSIFQNHFESS
jgi:hypothetical protein